MDTLRQYLSEIKESNCNQVTSFMTGLIIGGLESGFPQISITEVIKALPPESTDEIKTYFEIYKSFRSEQDQQDKSELKEEPKRRVYKEREESKGPMPPQSPKFGRS